MDVVIIDNYDSFTWNIYEYLYKAGAKEVHVIRNDQITLAELIAQYEAGHISHLILSPGPGHPSQPEMVGVCYEALEWFAGKVPVLGICLGLQILYEHYGGVVDKCHDAIKHGKVEEIEHDGRGIYAGLVREGGEKRFQVTRYHSLACVEDTLPECLEVASRTLLNEKRKESGNEEKVREVVMGVRHKKYVVEGVQYHPESFLSENGIETLKTFLGMSSGLWETEEQQKEKEQQKQAKPTSGAGKKRTILMEIYEQRKKDVEQSKQVLGQRECDFVELIQLDKQQGGTVLFKQIDFHARLMRDYRAGKLAVVAEIKRASPSKGMIVRPGNDANTSMVAARVASEYAAAGASGISVLTEPTWFKGSLFDMQTVRQTVDCLGEDVRPAVLRKDFLFDRYQVLEARVYGADSVLLIVTLFVELDNGLELLSDLVVYARELGMEPLVEINNAQELELAVGAGARVIGVNNRNLHSFDVDMTTTLTAFGGVADVANSGDLLLMALSGITTPADALVYTTSNSSNIKIHAVLVGEGLMKSNDKTRFISELNQCL